MRCCDRCALNNVQDEAHVILDCPDAQLRNQFQHLFDAIPAGSTARLFFLVLHDAFSSRFFKTNVLFLYSFLSYIHQSHVPSTFFFWCLVQSGLFLFLKLAFYAIAQLPSLADIAV